MYLDTFPRVPREYGRGRTLVVGVGENGNE
jgi:hypothetical protein